MTPSNPHIATFEHFLPVEQPTGISNYSFIINIVSFIIIAIIIAIVTLSPSPPLSFLVYH